MHQLLQAILNTNEDNLALWRAIQLDYINFQQLLDEVDDRDMVEQVYWKAVNCGNKDLYDAAAKRYEKILLDETIKELGAAKDKNKLKKVKRLALLDVLISELTKDKIKEEYDKMVTKLAGNQLLEEIDSASTDKLQDLIGLMPSDQIYVKARAISKFRMLSNAQA